MNKIRVVLINASDYLIEDSSVGLGIGYLKSYILKNDRNTSVKIFRKNIIQNIIKEKPDVLGISAISYYYLDALKIAKKIRLIFGKKIQIIIGGVHITVLPKSFDPIFDFGVIGEGEQTMLELISFLQKEQGKRKGERNRTLLKKIKGICYIDKKNKLVITQKRDLISRLDIIPHIDRRDFNHKYYNIILTSRGCPFNCLYCASQKFWLSNRVRFFSIEYLLEEIKNLNKIGIYHIAIWDDMCILDKNRIIELASRIHNEKNISKNTTFELSFNSSIYSDDIVKHLKQLNVVKVNMSFDSGSDSILQKIGRGTTCETNQIMYKQLVQNDIQVNGNFTVNNEEESELDLFKTILFIKKNKITNARVFVNNPLPGSNAWFFYIKKNNLKIKDIDYEIFKNKSPETISEFNTANVSTLGLGDLKKWALIIQEEILINQNNRTSFTKKITFKKLTEKLEFFSKKIDFCHFYKNILPFPKNITIKITNRCNLNCFMCINSKHRGSHLNDSDFTLEIAKKCLPDMIKFKPSIILSGGEPLLCDDIFDIAKLLTSYKIPVTLLTNGFTVKKYVKDILNSNITSISFSLDHYMDEKHNKIRGSSNSFRNLIDGLKELGRAKTQYNHNLKILVATVITKDNYSKLVEIYDFIEKLGFANEWNLRHLSFINKDIYKKQMAQKRSRNYPIDFVQGMVIGGDTYFNKEEISLLKEQFNIINDMAKVFKTKLVTEKSILKKLNDYYSGKDISKLTLCNGLDHLKISNNRILTFCEYEIGDLNKGGISEAWNSKRNIYFQRRFVYNNLLPQCFRCPRLKVKKLI